MRFKYSAFKNTGEAVEGDIDVKDKVEVLKFLESKGLKPISIKLINVKNTKIELGLFGQKITLSDKLFLTKYISLMLKAGMDIFKTVDILIADFEKPAMKAFLGEVRAGLEKGQQLHSVFEKYPIFFSKIFVNLIKAGESSGNLDGVFSDLNTTLTKENELRGKIKAALIYPCLLLGVAMMILIFLLTFALPKIAGVFTGSGFNPPLFSKVVFAIGLFLGNNIALFIGGGIFLSLGIFFFLAKTAKGRSFWQKMLDNAPLIKKIRQEIALERFATTFSTLLRSGVPITDAIEMSADIVGSKAMERDLRRIAKEDLVKGLTIGESFKASNSFPKTVSTLIAISEKTGHLDEILNTLAGFYDTEVDTSLKTLVSFLEPVLLMLIGGVVGTIALAIIVPIYQLVGQF
ncbi:MAG: type II secretion system F family protein [Candidatus Pacebacteria bacterium]|nr:type II secretion system F family protein [Candidatus Paceibacterota bacterium]